MQTNIHTRKRAFTMVELIFVIVILGILAAVAVPKMNASRDDAKIAASIANLKVLMTDLQTYHLAQKGGFATTAGTAGTTQTTDLTNAEKSCKGAGGTWASNACTFSSGKITDMTNVVLEEYSPSGTTVGASVGKAYAFNVGKSGSNGDKCLTFRIANSNVLEVTPATTSAGSALCTKFLGIGSVQSILTGQTSATDKTEKKITDTARDKAYFNFAAGNIS